MSNNSRTVRCLSRAIKLSFHDYFNNDECNILEDLVNIYHDIGYEILVHVYTYIHFLKSIV